MMKATLKSSFTDVIVFAAIILCCCSCRYQRKENWQGGKIDRPGEYDIQKGGYKILVTDDSNLIKYTVLNSKGETIIRSNDNVSAFQRWALFWDSVGNLWVQSSDIGDAVWKPVGQDKYKKEFITDSAVRNTMPIK